MIPPVRFSTIADSRFFVGAAGVINSIHVTGNKGEAFVFDLGLRPEQRARLEAGARVLPLPDEYRGLHPMLTKTAGDRYWSDGVLVLVDSDMIVTSLLDDLIEQAAAGKIAVFPDHETTRDRQFPEWVAAFDLSAPLRPQRYVNAGLVAISLDHWPGFFERWRQACRNLPEAWTTDPTGPYGAGDQDALNALLMSEVPAEGIWIGPDRRSIHSDGLTEVQVIDSRTLECRSAGMRPAVLHYSLNPKAWERQAWSRIRPRDAYVRLLRRLLFARDVPIHAARRDVPAWLWPGVGRAVAGLVFLLFAAGVLNFLRHLRDSAAELADRLTGSFL